MLSDQNIFLIFGLGLIIYLIKKLIQFDKVFFNLTSNVFCLSLKKLLWSKNIFKN